MMKAFVCQLDIVWERKAANFDKVRRLIAEAAPAPGSLVALPEMFATGFSMNVAGISETAEGETEQFLSRTAKEFGIYIAGGVVTKTNVPGLSLSGNQFLKGRNEAVVFGPEGQLRARYGKLHSFNPAGEGAHYISGNVLVSFDWQGLKTALFICYDLRFPEAFRLAALNGAEAFVVIANWPRPRIAHWMNLLQARAIENQAFVFGVNRCGHTSKMDFDGRSLIVDPQGVILGDAGTTEQMIGAEIQMEQLRAWRREFPVLADARKELLNFGGLNG